MDKIRVIKLSLQCRRFSSLGLVPIIGIPFLVCALVCYQRARREAGNEWHPAARQLHWGLTLAIVGLGLAVLTMGLIVLAVRNAYM